MSIELQPVAVEVDTMRADQVDGALARDQLDLGGAGHQEVHVLLQVLSALHGHEGHLDLLLLVPGRLDGQHAHVALLGVGHQDGSLDEKPVLEIDGFGFRSFYKDTSSDIITKPELFRNGK